MMLAYSRETHALNVVKVVDQTLICATAVYSIAGVACRGCAAICACESDNKR